MMNRGRGNYNQHILHEKITYFQLNKKGNDVEKWFNKSTVEIKLKIERTVYIQIEEASCSNENPRTIKRRNKTNTLKEK